jgi:phenylacetate-CoA ligase
MIILPSDGTTTLSFLKQSQFYTPEKLQALQWQKLQPLLQHAATKVPYYRGLFADNNLQPGDIDGPAALAQLPMLTKAHIRSAGDTLLTEGVDTTTLLENYTGGSTATPLKFYQDDNYRMWADAARTRAWKHMPGFDEDEIEAVLWGADRDIAYTLGPKQVLKVFLQKRGLTLNTFSASDRKFRTFTRLMNWSRPRLLRGYASSLVYFAERTARS